MLSPILTFIVRIGLNFSSVWSIGFLHFRSLNVLLDVAPGGDSHMKQTGMLVVSLRFLDFGLTLGVPGKAPIFYSAKVSFRVLRRNTELHKEKEKSNFFEIYDNAFKNYN